MFWRGFRPRTSSAAMQGAAIVFGVLSGFYIFDDAIRASANTVTSSQQVSSVSDVDQKKP
jgi:hypothetical protein